jgi:RNA polymerase-interacting CarD/CdnL/TRCF family regulator
MSETPTPDRIRDVLAEVYAVELRDLLTAAVSGAPHWRREAQELLAKIKSGCCRSHADGHSDLTRGSRSSPQDDRPQG